MHKFLALIGHVHRVSAHCVQHPSKAFLISVGWRVFLAWLVRTSFDPDEHWQGPEVAHRLVFGYGHLTWEWATGVRSIVHPLIYTVPFILLKYSNLDFAIAVRFAPRVVAACVGAVNDVALTQLAATLFGTDIAAWTLVCQLLSWFNAFVLSRPFSNVWEAALLSLALLASTRQRSLQTKAQSEHEPESDVCTSPTDHDQASGAGHRSAGGACGFRYGTSRRRITMFIAFGMSFILRPTCGLVLLPVLIVALLNDIYSSALLTVKHHKQGTSSTTMAFLARAGSQAAALLSQGIMVAIILMGSNLLMDVAFYKRFVCAPWELFKFNVLENKSAAYGTHPGHWYFTQGLPAMLASYVPLVLVGLYITMTQSLCMHSASSAAEKGKHVPGSLQKRLPLWPAGLVLSTVLAYSGLQHKEFRFVLPMFQLLLPYAGVALSRCIAYSSSQSTTNTSSDRERAGMRDADAKSLKDSGVHVQRRHPIWRASLPAPAMLLLLLQVPVLLYFGVVHQRGTTQVMEYLAQDQSLAGQRNASVLFLTNCHATPFYSHLHINVTMTFLDCSPPGLQEWTQSINVVGATGMFHLAKADETLNDSKRGVDVHATSSFDAESHANSCARDDSAETDGLLTSDMADTCSQVHMKHVETAPLLGLSEQEVFMRDPLFHLCRVFGCASRADQEVTRQPYSHLVMYDSLIAAVQPFLSAHSYHEQKRFHQTVSDERFIVVFRR